MNRLAVLVLAAISTMAFAIRGEGAQSDLPKFSSSYRPGEYKGLNWSSKTPDAALKDGKPVVLFVYFSELADKKPNNIAYNIEIRCLADPKLKDVIGSVSLVKLSAKNAEGLPRHFGQTTTASLYVLDLAGNVIYPSVNSAPSTKPPTSSEAEDSAGSAGSASVTRCPIAHVTR